MLLYDERRAWSGVLALGLVGGQAVGFTLFEKVEEGYRHFPSALSEPHALQIMNGNGSVVQLVTWKIMNFHIIPLHL